MSSPLSNQPKPSVDVQQAEPPSSLPSKPSDSPSKKGTTGLPAAGESAQLLAAPAALEHASPNVGVIDTDSVGKATVSCRDAPAGSLMLESGGAVLPAPNVYTVQLTASQHLMVEGSFQYLAHSCQPNCRVVVLPDTAQVQLWSVRPVSSGEFLTFDYCTTEFDMDSPFSCACGSEGCRGQIQGFKYLAKEQAEQLQPLCSPYILGRLSSLGRESGLFADSRGEEGAAVAVGVAAVTATGAGAVIAASAAEAGSL